MLRKQGFLLVAPPIAMAMAQPVQVAQSVVVVAQPVEAVQPHQVAVAVAK